MNRHFFLIFPFTVLAEHEKATFPEIRSVKVLYVTYEKDYHNKNNPPQYESDFAPSDDLQSSSQKKKKEKSHNVSLLAQFRFYFPCTVLHPSVSCCQTLDI